LIGLFVTSFAVEDGFEVVGETVGGRISVARKKVRAKAARPTGNNGGPEKKKICKTRYGAQMEAQLGVD
jgi:hypothetical protein